MSNKTFLSMSWVDDYIPLLLNPLNSTRLGIGLDDAVVSITTKIKKESKLNYLKFLIPYAKQFITLEMCFNSLYPELGPDLIINKEEHFYSLHNKDFGGNLSSLANWNFSNDSSLIDLLKEFIDLYKKYQLEVLKIHSDTIKLDPELLINTIQFENFEINVIQGGKQLEIKLLIKLNTDLSVVSNLHEKLKLHDPLLFINFSGSGYNRVTPELYLPPYLTRLFNGSETLHIPPYSEAENIADYIDKVKICIIEKVKAVSICIEKRKQFIATLLAIQGQSIIEYDVINFQKVKLLLEHSDFRFQLTFDLPVAFPTKQFTMTLHSINYMTDQGKPVSRCIQNFPYSPRWEPKQMITKALAYIIENELKKFQEISFKNFQF